MPAELSSVDYRYHSNCPDSFACASIVESDQSAPANLYNVNVPLANVLASIGVPIISVIIASHSYISILVFLLEWNHWKQICALFE